MAVKNRRPVNRRRPASRRARRNPLLLFVVASVAFGLLFFCVASLIRWIAMPAEDEDTTDAYAEIPTAPEDTDVTTPAPTLPEDDFTEPTNNTDPPISDPEYVKQDPPVRVSYADTVPYTVALGDKVDCDSVILIDVSEGTVVASKSSEKRIYPASLTKVMTLITAYDYISDPYEERFTMTYDILHPLVNSGNSLAGFEVGESSRLIDYMYGMIMFSGADAAEGIATYCSGSVDAFVTAMNRKAAEIGLTGSHFTNPVGTHDADHYSTAHDMALVLGYAYEVDLLAEILNTYRYTSEPTEVHPDGLYWESNLQQRMKGDESGTCQVLGGKTGFTNDAKHCVVAYARSNKTGKYYLFAATGGEGMYDPIWDCINTLKDYVE